MTDARPPSQPRSSGPAPAFAAHELASVTGGRLLARSDRRVRGAAVDSRVVEPGQLFVALPGERTDGHAFLGDAAARGAAALVVTRQPDDVAVLGDVSVLLVDDGLAALHAIAAAWRTRFDPLVVGVTGSIAKTSTKEAIAAVLSTRFTTLKNEGNQNNEIGLPLTVLRMGPEHEAAVLEMGMYVGGEIADLARIGRPRIGVVTAVQAVHLSRIGTIEAIEKAKGELVEALPRADDGGVAILNADDNRVVRMRQRTAARSIRYGFNRNADVRASDVESAGLDGMRFRLDADDESVRVQIPTLGRLSVHNATAAAAVGVASGLSIREIVAGLERGWSAPHRVQVARAGGVTIIDDSYNASVGSMKAALDLLCDLPGRRIAVLGEMLELGPNARYMHRKVAVHARRAADVVMAVGAIPGTPAEALGELADLHPGHVISVPDRATARARLLELLRPGDVVLVKASRGVELDKLVDDLVAALGAHPEEGSEIGS